MDSIRTAALIGMFLISTMCLPLQADTATAAGTDAPTETPVATPAGGGEAKHGAQANDEASAATSEKADEQEVASDDGEEVERPYILQYAAMPWPDVIRRFAQTADRPLIGEPYVEGALTFYDAEPYSYQEALDTLNIFLGMRGHQLVERGRYLQLISRGEMGAVKPPIVAGERTTKDMRPSQLVTAVVPIKYIDATEAAKMAMPMVSAFGYIAPLGRGKGIVITDTVASIEYIRQMIAALDRDEMVDETIKTYRLKHASAESVAAIINNTLGGYLRNRRDRRTAVPPAVRAASDPRSNIVVLRGEADKIAMAEQMIHEIDAEDAPNANVSTRMFLLKNARAGEVARTLAQVFKGRQASTTGVQPSVVGDDATNRIIVTAPEEQLAEAERLIRELDAEVDDGGGMRVFRLEHADATQMVGIVNAAMLKRLPNGRAIQTVSVASDRNTNSLVISGNAGDLVKAAKVVEQIDTATAPEAAREVRVVHLKAGNAAQVGKSLRTLLTKSVGGKPAVSNVLIEAEAYTNSLLIAADTTDWPQIEKVLAQLKEVAGGDAEAVTRHIPLKHARADQLANTLRQAYGNTRARRVGSTQPLVPVVVSHAAESNSLVISASESDQQDIAELVALLDVPASQMVDPVITVRLESAEASELAEVIKAMLPPTPRGQEPSVVINADAASNTVLLRAPESRRKELEALIAKLDSQTTSKARERRLLKLKHASATALATTLGRLYTSTPTPSRSRRGRPPTPTTSDDGVVISPGPGDSTLLVEGPRDEIAELVKLVEAMDQEGGPGQLEVRTYVLTKTDAPGMADSLKALFQPGRQASGMKVGDPEPRFEADANTNQLLIAATGEQFQKIDEVIKQVEASTAVASQTRTFALKHAKCEEVAPILSSMLESESGRGAAPRRRGQNASPTQATVRVAAMEATNSVVVQAPPQKMALAEELVKTFDVPEASTAIVIEIVHLKNAQAQSLAASVNAVLAARATAASSNTRRRPQRPATPGADQTVTVTAEPNSNSVLVRGPADEVADVLEMISRLDGQSTSGAAQVRLFKLENSDASEMAKSLGQLFRDIIKQRSQGQRDIPAPPFAISADVRTNALVVSTTPAHFALVDELVKQLDKDPDRPLRDVRYVWLTNADPYDVQRQLEAMYSDRRGADKPVIEADLFTTALTLIGKTEDLDAMETVIAKLDAAAEDNSRQVRVIKMDKIGAERMAELLRRIYPQVSSNPIMVTDELPVNDRKAPAPEPSRPDAPSPPPFDPDSKIEDDAKRKPGKDSDTGARLDSESIPLVLATVEVTDAEETEETDPDAPVTVAVDPRANALIISATRRQLEEIQSLIDELSRDSAGVDSEIRIFKLSHADPKNVAKTLQTLFTQRVEVPQQQQQNQRNRQSNQRTRTQTVSTVVAVAELRTMSVIVRAKSMDMDMVAQLVKELDTVPTVTSEVRVFVLANANANEVAKNLKELFANASVGDADKQKQGDNNQRNAQAQRQAQVRRELELSAGNTDSTGIRITPNPATNSVVVAAPPDAMQIVVDIIRELDQSAGQASATSVRLYPLKHASVAETVKALQAVFPTRQPAGRGRTAQSADGIAITGDEAGKQILVSAPAAAHELIAKVIGDIDARQAGIATEVKVYSIEHADATTLAGALAEALVPTGSDPRQRGQLRISPDRGSNTLVVRATADEHQRIDALINEMDVSPAMELPVQTITLQNADASKVAEVLKSVFSSDTSSTQRYSRWRRPSPTTRGQSVIIEADRDARMLMVRADDETFARIKALATEMDRSTSEGLMQRVVIPLKHAQATTVADSLAQAFRPQRGVALSPNDQVTIVGEYGSNSLIVTASEANLERVKSLLEKVDTPETGNMVTQFMLLKHGQAPDLAQVLQRIAANTATPAVRGAPQRRVVVTADATSNGLIINGPSLEVTQLMQMALQLDQASESAASQIYVLKLEKGDATEVVSMVQNLYDQERAAARSERRTVDPFAVSVDQRANAVVMVTTKAMYDRMKGLIDQVETLKPRVGTPRIIILEHADPEDVNEAIQNLFGQSGSSTNTNQRGRRTSRNTTTSTSSRVEVTVLAQSKGLMVNASDEDFEAVEKLVKALDKAAAESKPELRVVKLKYASNTRVASAVTQMYRNAQRGADASELVSVTALPQSDAVVIAAPSNRLDEVEALIKQLDSEDVAPGVEIRIYTLTHAQPSKVINSVNSLLAQIRATRPGEPLTAQADDRTRSIIVTARGPVFEQVGRIIESLDRAPAFAAAEVMVIPLKHADATRLTLVLQEMLRPDNQNVLTPEALALQEQVRRLRLRGKDGEQLPELDLSKPIKIAADPVQPNQQGSNRLVISSTADNLKAMAAIVKLLDALPIAEDVKVRLIMLQHADAESIRDTLREIFTQGQEFAGKEGTSTEGDAEPREKVGKALVNPLSVSADLRTNALVISGQEPTVDLAEAIIRDLDKEHAKVVTEIRLFPLKHADVARLAPLLQSVFTEGQAVEGTEGLRTQVTRLRTHVDGQLRTTDIPKTRAALTIQGDVGTQVLVVSARADVMPLIADVIKTLDIPSAAAANSVQILPLKYADATRIREVINAIYTGANAQLLRDEDQPTVVVDTRTNALVISASSKTFTMIRVLVRRLDAEQEIDTRDIQLIVLKNADAVAMTQVLQEMMDARVQRQQSLGVKDAEALRVVIAPDPRTNALIVAGSRESYDLVKSIAQQLDGASPAISGQVQLLPLKHGNAGTLATSLQNLFNQRYAAAATADVQRQKPVILADVRTNSLMVSATAADSQVLQSLLARLDVELTDPSVLLTVIPLKHNDAGVIGPTIQDLFRARLQSMTPAGQQPNPQDRVDVTADALSNALIISASKENLGLIQGLLAKVDVEPPAEGGIIKLYPLKNADVTRVSTMLQNLISQGLYKPGAAAAGSNAALAAREKVAIVADIRTNVLIVSASKVNLAVIDRVIASVDGDIDDVLGDLKVFKLANADAVRLAPTLQELFRAKRQAEIDAGGSGKALAVTFVADVRTNSLLVAGSKEAFDAVAALVKDLDAEGVITESMFRVFTLKRATATAIAPMMDELFTNRPIREGETRYPVTIVPDTRANALVVGATPEDMALVRSLIQRMDGEADQALPMQVFGLKKADAQQVAATLNDLLEQQGGAADAGIRVTVDERINAIVVNAGPNDMLRIKSIIERLDTEDVTKVTEIRIFALKNAKATELTPILLQALTNKPAPLNAQSPNRQTLLRFISASETGRKLMSSALQESLLIEPDSRSNSLVVAAPVDSMPLLARLITALDSTIPRKAELEIFTLENADASQMGELLSQMFKLQQATQDGARSITYTLNGDEENSDVSATLGTDDQLALSVTVDVRTNSLIVGGTEQYIALARKVIEKLDSSPAQERGTRIYRPRFAAAADIETALRAFLEQERASLSRTLGAEGIGAATARLEQEVSVVAEQNSNALLISASPRYMPQIMQMIEEIDQQRPQVLIQVLLAEVRLEDELDLGLDWNVSKMFSGTQVDFGTDFGVQNAITRFGGFNLSITGGDWELFARALQSDNRLSILSRPQVTAADNQTATITVGQRVPLITDSRVTDQGDTINSIAYEDVSVQLEVTPRINPDGMVTLDISPTVRQLSDSSVEVADGVSAPIINNRQAQTTVSVQDGHTIMIGGLITTVDSDQENKVPVLGDIPLVGLAFRSTTNRKERTELLIIMTPFVLNNVKDADRLTEKYAESTNLIKDMKRDELQEQVFKPFRGELNGRLDETQQSPLMPDQEQNGHSAPSDDATEPEKEPGASSDRQNSTEVNDQNGNADGQDDGAFRPVPGQPLFPDE